MRHAHGGVLARTKKTGGGAPLGQQAVPSHSPPAVFVDAGELSKRRSLDVGEWQGLEN